MAARAASAAATSTAGWAARVASAVRAAEQRHSIVLLTGAGVSVGAGIPDFRSPGGGMYSTLRPDLLTATPDQRRAMERDPTTVVSWELFRDTNLPYLEVRRNFILGLAERRWKATISHFFVRLLEDHGALAVLLTQNIDGLDFQTGVDPKKICSVHGTLGQVECEFCSAPCDVDVFRAMVKKQVKDIYGVDKDAPAESTKPVCQACGKPGLKPATVLYGRSLPAAFFEQSREHVPEAPLLIVMGTSLTVGPANQVPRGVKSDCLRLVVNREPVGQAECGIRYGKSADRDVFAAGDCDDRVLDLVEELGWLEELAQYREDMCDASQRLLDERLERTELGADSSAAGAAAAGGEDQSSSAAAGDAA